MTRMTRLCDLLIVGLPAVTLVLYFLTGLAFAYKRQPWWAVMYIAYAVANVGLIWASLVTTKAIP